MKRNILRLALIASVALIPVACSKSQPPAAEQEESAESQKVTVTEADKTEAKNIFATRCTPCHGTQGKGDGPASAQLDPKPRNFTLKDWQSKVPDDEIEKAIQYGGAAVSKSPAMPPNPDLVAKPGVVAALRMHVRSLAQ